MAMDKYLRGESMAAISQAMALAEDHERYNHVRAKKLTDISSASLDPKGAIARL